MRAQAPAADTTASPAELARARQLYQSAERHFAARRYQLAYDQMKEAYRLSKLPDLLFNLGKMAAEMGRRRDAVAHLELYLKVRPDAQDRAEVEAQLAQQRKKLAAEESVLAPVVGGGESGSGARPGGEVAPGSKPAVAPGDASAGVPLVAVRAEPKVGARPARPAARARAPWPAIGVAAGGAVLLLIGAGLGGGAAAAAGTVSSAAMATPPSVFDANLQATQARGQALQGAGIALDVLGLLSIAGGAAWTGYWYHERRQSGPLRAAQLPMGPTAQLGGSF